MQMTLLRTLNELERRRVLSSHLYRARTHCAHIPVRTWITHTGRYSSTYHVYSFTRSMRVRIVRSYKQE